MLRDIAKEIRDVTFSHESRFRYNLRLSLGLLAGIAVGFLISADTKSAAVPEGQAVIALTTLAPMALAFLAGYSVDLVFAVVDKFVSFFKS